MSVTEKSSKMRLQANLALCAITAVVSMLLTMLLMLGLSSAIAKGMIETKHDAEFVMLCVFLANCITTSAMFGKKEGGALISTMLSGLAYIIILLILAMSAGSEKLINAGMIRMSICAIVGCAFGFAIRIRGKKKSVRRKRKK